MVVQVALVPGHAIRVCQEFRNRFLRRRLSCAAGDRDHARAGLATDEAAEVLKGRGRVRDLDDDGIAAGPPGRRPFCRVHHGAGGTLLD